MGKIRKKTSKRQSIRTKFVIQKKVTSARRKTKKEAKKLKALGITPKSKILI